MKTIAICDMEPIAVEGLRSLLEPVETLRVVAEETSLAAGLEHVKEIGPDLVILDKGFGTQAILEAVRDLVKSGGGTRAIVWGTSLSEAEALRFLHAGASGVTRKTATLAIVRECVEAVAAGGTWMEDSLIRSPEQPQRDRSSLTARELQVTQLVERGLTNKEIARELGIRSGTVKIHLKHIFEKTGVRGRYGLALSGLKDRGLLLAPAMVM